MSFSSAPIKIADMVILEYLVHMILSKRYYFKTVPSPTMCCSSISHNALHFHLPQCTAFQKCMKVYHSIQHKCGGRSNQESVVSGNLSQNSFMLAFDRIVIKFHLQIFYLFHPTAKFVLNYCGLITILFSMLKLRVESRKLLKHHPKSRMP